MIQVLNDSENNKCFESTLNVTKIKALFKTIDIEKHRICFKFGIGINNLKTNRIVEVQLKRILLGY